MENLREFEDDRENRVERFSASQIPLWMWAVIVVGGGTLITIIGATIRYLILNFFNKKGAKPVAKSGNVLDRNMADYKDWNWGNR
jgi:hypothetical protein